MFGIKTISIFFGRESKFRAACMSFVWRVQPKFCLPIGNFTMGFHLCCKDFPHTSNNSMWVSSSLDESQARCFTSLHHLPVIAMELWWKTSRFFNSKNSHLPRDVGFFFILIILQPWILGNLLYSFHFPQADFKADFRPFLCVFF